MHTYSQLRIQIQVITTLDKDPQHLSLIFFCRHFACLSKGDVIAINYNKKIYELNVLETKPAEAVSIIECDMNVEFEAPPGYVVSSHPTICMT